MGLTLSTPGLVKAFIAPLDNAFITLDTDATGLSPLPLLVHVTPVGLPPLPISRRPGVSWTLARG